MPTDEQRERFEKWAETESFDLTANIHTGKYIYSDTLTAWLTWQARDAEVQALRKLVDHAKRIFQNAEVRSGYCVCGETPERHGNSADCPYTDRGQWESELWLKRAALAGGETGEAE